MSALCRTDELYDRMCAFSLRTAVAQQVVADAIGRRAVNEPFYYRHILLSGLFGTGKRTAAELVGALTAVVGASDPPPPPPGAPRCSVYRSAKASARVGVSHPVLTAAGLMWAGLQARRDRRTTAC